MQRKSEKQQKFEMLILLLEISVHLYDHIVQWSEILSNVGKNKPALTEIWSPAFTYSMRANAMQIR